MLVYIFPGQGSQKRGMGATLFDEVREYRAVERDVDALLGYSLRQLCLEDPKNCISQTQFTQPSLYVVNALHYYKAVQESGARPAFVAGHSLGEYNALLAAGAFDFLTGLRLVQKRGELMAQARDGTMAAVVGVPADRIRSIVQSELSSIDVANFNTPSQTVISGPVDAIKRAGPIFEAAGARMYIPLQVSAAFHSRYMADASRSFGEYLTQFAFDRLRIPVIANVTGQPYPEGVNSSQIAKLLADQIAHSVLWLQSVRYLTDRGVTEFKELGPGNVLTRLTEQIAAETETSSP